MLFSRESIGNETIYEIIFILDGNFDKKEE